MKGTHFYDSLVHRISQNLHTFKVQINMCLALFNPITPLNFRSLDQTNPFPEGKSGTYHNSAHCLLEQKKNLVLRLERRIELE